MKRVFLFLVGAALAAGQSFAVEQKSSAFVETAVADKSPEVNAKGRLPLTFEECVREVGLNNPDLYAAREGVHVARANLLGGYSPFLPQVSASAGASKNNQELDTGYQKTTSYTAGLAVEQNLFNGFQDAARLNQYRSKLSQAEINLQRVKSNLSASLRQAFAALMYAQDYLVLAENIAGRRKKNSELVEMRFEAGSEDKGSLLRSQALYSQALQDVAEAKRRISVAQYNLNKVLGRQDGGGLVVTGVWEHASVPAAPALQGLVETTPEYRTAKEQCAIAREQVRVARSGFLPSWSVSGDYGLNDDDSIIPHNESWNVGTAVGLNIFDGGQTIFALRSAQASLRSTEAQLTSVANSTLTTLEEAYTSWQNAVDNVRIQAQLLEAAEVRVEIANIKYSNGLMSFQDWDTIGNDLITNQQNMLNREQNAITARAAWEKTVGISIVP